MLFYRSLIITQAIVILCMVIPSQAMLYRTMSRTAPIKQRSSLLQKNVKKRPQIPQERTPIQPKFMLPKKQIFNVSNRLGSPKKSWGPFLAAFGLGWLWYSKEDKEKKDEEKSQETTEKKIS